jgi:quercetin dioxygenase-like cupin family protein
VGEVERWHLPSIEASGTREPRVLFSQPEFRGVVIDLNQGDELGEHRMYEHCVLQVISGRLEVSGEDGEMECETGTLLTFVPKEARSVRALEPSRILLVLAPWPGEGHFPDDREAESEEVRTQRKSAEPPDD